MVKIQFFLLNFLAYYWMISPKQIRNKNGKKNLTGLNKPKFFFGRTQPNFSKAGLLGLNILAQWAQFTECERA